MRKKVGMVFRVKHELGARIPLIARIAEII